MTVEQDGSVRYFLSSRKPVSTKGLKVSIVEVHDLCTEKESEIVLGWGQYLIVFVVGFLGYWWKDHQIRIKEFPFFYNFITKGFSKFSKLSPFPIFGQNWVISVHRKNEKIVSIVEAGRSTGIVNIRKDYTLEAVNLFRWGFTSFSKILSYI